MTSDHWKRVEDIFNRVLEEPEEKRESTLIDLCGANRELRCEVTELLHADRTADDFIHPPTPSTIGDLLGRSVDENQVGRTIGPYTITRILGVGGMGEVYLARRSDDEFEKEVAIKVIKRSIASKDILERFKRERQALARLEHKNIARLIDGGTTDDGLPYFVLEYVDGKPLNEHCDSQRLPIRERLELFLEICSAVEHAHKNLVIHRDLKPGNILVDSGGAPRLLDFGIAKVLDPGDELDPQARTEARLMTPEYASPEQIRGSAVSTGSDVYSLGVLLYELLSGHHPHRATTRNRNQVYLAVLEDEPDKPSTAVDREEEIPLDDGGSTRITPADVGALRREPPKSLRKKLSGDLDNIILMAMHKDPDRRYASVDGLSQDIARYLAGRPVVARGDGIGYRLSKFIARNRTAATACSILALAGLVLGSLYVAALIGDRARLAEIKRLSDLKRYESLTARMASLWPLHPRKRDEMRAWIDAADTLLAGHASHRATLIELRSNGRELPHPRVEELEALRANLALCEAQLAEAEEGNRTVELERLKESMQEKARKLEEEIERAPAFEFDDAGLASWHDALATLVEGLDTFAGAEERGRTRANIVARLAEIERIERVTLIDNAELWDEAIESIVDTVECPAYDGLEITPQTGLVPLRRNGASDLWEFWHVASGDEPERGTDGKYVLTESTGAVFVLVPGGTFWMGAQNEDANGINYDPAARENEQPMIEVSLAPYFLSKYELTQGQWKRITGEKTTCYYPAGNDAGETKITWTHPVEQVSWNESRALVDRMGWTLPTEAQWEFACRGGTQTPWSTGTERDALIGTVNLADQSARRAGATWTAIQDWPELDDGYPVHAPVDHYAPNPYGFHSMHGNVWEWCADYYRLSLGGFERASDGEAKAVLGEQRAVRGGGFNHIATFTRSSYRSNSPPTAEAQSVGMRPAMLLVD